MNIFVCIKQVPDTETKIKIAGDGAGIDPAGVKWVMNPYDEFAVEEALKIKEAKGQGAVTVFSVGPKARVIESLRTALAMGADEAVVVDAPESVDNFTVAKALAAALKQTGACDLVLTGKLAIDDNQATVPQMVAELMQMPHLTVVSKLTVTDSGFAAEREVEGGERQVFEVPKPAMIAANKGLNMPRYASLPGIMKAKKKTIKELTLEGLGVAATDAKIGFSNLQLPPDKAPVKMIAGSSPDDIVKQLVDLLRNEAKVL
jgi:electron transfer flavoprotein beta subunit